MKELINYDNNVFSKEERTVEELLATELQLLIIEIQSLIDALYVYEKVSSKENHGNRFLFLTFYESIELSLIYRIIIGLSRLFDTNSNARTLRKVLNALQQNKNINNSKEIDTLIRKILSDDSNVRETYNFKNLRDKYFAHLDKDMRFSTLTIFTNIEYTNEMIVVLENINKKLYKLDKICFSSTLPERKQINIEIPNIADLKDVKRRAEKFLNDYPALRDTMAINEKGLYYLIDEKLE